jgi:riboflavin synthase
MFTGIIEGLATVSKIRSIAQSKRLTLTAQFDLAGTRIGDSIAVNGACLTVVELAGNRFSVDVSPETLTKTTIGGLKMADQVNLERALKLSGRLDGHLVSGHIDGTGTIRKMELVGNVLVITFAVGEALSDYMIQKGSVAVDGVSLTINRWDPLEFDVTIIPHTAKLTTLGWKHAGDPVNIETDLIGKYVERFIGKYKGHHQGKKVKSSIDMNFLAKSGFL